LRRSLTRTGLLAAACAVVVSGCATSPTNYFPNVFHTTTCPAKPAGDESCRAQISVTCFPIIGCHVGVPFKIYANGNNVFWDLDDAALKKGFLFADPGGIFFKEKAGQDNFTCSKVADRKSYKCDNGKAEGEYQYGISLDGPGGLNPHVDPWVVNHARQ
jgi:hypothetical protein